MPCGRAFAGQPIERDDADQLIAVDHLAALVDGDASIGVAIEGKAQVRLRVADDPRERLRSGGAAVEIDVDAVRLAEAHVHARAGAFENRARDAAR